MVDVGSILRNGRTQKNERRHHIPEKTYIQEKSETSNEIWIRIYKGILRIDSEPESFDQSIYIYDQVPQPSQLDLSICLGRMEYVIWM